MIDRARFTSLLGDLTAIHHKSTASSTRPSATQLTESTEMTKVFTFVFVAICVPVIVNGADIDTSPVIQNIHPKVFEMVTSSMSDTEEPVVTEINLDAVAKNRNQFDLAKVTKSGEWLECVGEKGTGFQRFKTIKSDKKHFVIEFQRNAGGTLTSASLIEFVIETRDIRKAGKPHEISVLRIMSIETKSD